MTFVKHFSCGDQEPGYLGTLIASCAGYLGTLIWCGTCAMYLQTGERESFLMTESHVVPSNLSRSWGEGYLAVIDRHTDGHTHKWLPNRIIVLERVLCASCTGWLSPPFPDKECMSCSHMETHGIKACVQWKAQRVNSTDPSSVFINLLPGSENQSTAGPKSLLETPTSSLWV